MTFTELQGRIAERLGIPATATESYARIGRAINDVYREVTSSLNIPLPRRSVAVVGTTTQGFATVTFSGIEKIERLILDTSGTPVVIPEVSFDQIRNENPAASDNVTAYAIESTTATSVTIRMNVVAQTAFDLKVDGRATVTDLSGVLVPAFAVSFHDVLIHGVMVSEYRKSEKVALMRAAQIDYERRLSQLRLDIAQSTSLSIRQGMNDGSTAAASVSGGSGGSATSGGESYIQTGLMTFDRDPLAPFAVTSGSAMVANLDADKLDGQHGAYYLDSTNLTGTIPLARLSGITNTQIDAAAAIARSKLNFGSGLVNADIAAAAAIGWSKVSKAGSSLADLATRSASDLSSGTVAEARLGSGTGSINKVLRGNSTWGDPPGVTTDGASRIQQIAFAATQSPSVDANTLDDYEEGTWTPSLGGNTTYTSRTGTYTKIGNRVFITGNIVVNVLGTGSASVISGLPFATAGVSTGIVGYFSNIALSVTWAGCYMNASGTSLALVALTAAAVSVTDPASLFGNSAQIHFSIQYSV